MTATVLHGIDRRMRSLTTPRSTIAASTWQGSFLR